MVRPLGDMTASDESLAKSVQQGDESWYSILVARYEDKMLRYGRKFLSDTDDIEDIVQNVFISAFRNIQSFDTTQKFSPWLYRIAHNAFVNEIRKKSHNPLLLVDFDTFVSHIASEDLSEKTREQSDMKVLINLGLEKLPAKYREVLVLYYLEELSYKEIAEVLHVPTGTVGVRVKRAKEALKKFYKESDITYDA